MKVLDLQCAQGHSFEGWFGSQGDYDTQRSQGLVTCPVCNDSEIVKMLSAPRLNLGRGVAPVESHSATSSNLSDGAGISGTGSPFSAPNHLPQSAPSSPAPTALAEPRLGASNPEFALNPDTLQHIQAAMMKLVRHVMANTEDVGTQFAEEARKIHYGEREERNIRGQATAEETEALIDEGIDVMPLPVPENLKGPLQ